MRYRIWLVTLPLWGVIGWGQVAPWPLAKWNVYRVQNGQPVGPPLPETVLLFSADSCVAIVDTVGMSAAGIQAWWWRLSTYSDEGAGWGFPYALSSSANPFFFRLGNFPQISVAPPYLLQLWVRRGNDSVASFRSLVFYRTWGSLAYDRVWACAGGEAEVVVDFTSTDVDSLRIWVGKGGIGYDSTVMKRPGVWRFPVPAVPDTYTIRTLQWTKGRSMSAGYGDFGQLFVVSKPRSCLLPMSGAVCAGEPVEVALNPFVGQSSPPRQVLWDFTGDNGVDAVGFIGRYVYSTSGTYLVRAFVEWAGGCRDTLAVTVSVGGGPLTLPTLLSTSPYVPGTLAEVRFRDANGLVLVDWEADGTYEGAAFPLSTQTYQAPRYVFNGPPPPGGYPLRIRQHFCGSVREDLLQWNPTISTAPVNPSGSLWVDGQVFCAGDTVRLYIRPGENFVLGAPGYRVAWNFGSGWTAPTETAVETTIVWGGQPLLVQAMLYHPSGGTRTLSTSLSAPASLRVGFLFTQVAPADREGCGGHWCVDQERIWCGGQSFEVRLLSPPRTSQPWQWRLYLPTDTVTFPASAIPAVYRFTLPTAPGVYVIQSQLLTSCGTWTEVYMYRVAEGGTGRASTVMYLPACAGSSSSSYTSFGAYHELFVCGGQQVWIDPGDGLSSSGGGFQRVRWVYADGRPVEVSRVREQYVLVAPFTPGTYTVYQLWESCGGRIDTVTLRLLVKAGVSASFKVPRGVCVGRPITFERVGPASLAGHPSFLSWGFGDGTSSWDTSRWVTHTYMQPGVYFPTLSAFTPSCGSSSFYQRVQVAERPPVVQILSATLVNNLLTFQGDASGADSLVWDFGDGSTAIDVLSGTHIYGGNGPYTLRFYGFNGCGGTVAQVQVTSLSHEVAQGGWRLYPNPTRSEVWVDAPVGGGEVRIYTLMGQLVGRWPVEEGQSRLLLEGLSRGLYIVRLIGGRTVGQEKLLLE